MKGKIRTLEKCSACLTSFKPVKHPRNGDILDYECRFVGCKERPRTFYIDARDMGAGKIYKDKRGRRFENIDAAHRQLEEMRAQIDKNEFDPADWMPSKLRAYTVKEMSEKWLARVERDRSHSYARHSRTEFEMHILPAIGEKTDVRDFRTSHSEKIYDSMVGKGRAPKTVKNVLGTWQTFLNWLYYIEVIQRVPRIPIVKVPQKAGSWINREKQAHILSLIPECHRLIFETLMETAERPGEVCAHKKKDLMDGEICIERAFDERGRLKESKSGKVIYRGISLGLWKKLSEYSHDKLPEAWLFLDQNGQPYSRDKLYKIWARACKKAGINISLYAGTRHSRASQKRLEMEKQVAEACRKELGHAASEVTMKHYARDRRDEI